jgi:hypothetical protein
MTLSTTDLVVSGTPVAPQRAVGQKPINHIRNLKYDSNRLSISGRFKAAHRTIQCAHCLILLPAEPLSGPIMQRRCSVMAKVRPRIGSELLIVGTDYDRNAHAIASVFDLLRQQAFRRASSDASDIVPSPNTLIHFCGDKHIPALLDICGTGGPSLGRYGISADRPSSHEPSRHRRILACWSSGVRVGAKAGWRQLCQICQMGDAETARLLD